jgi:hypothetical protein
VSLDLNFDVNAGGGLGMRRLLRKDGKPSPSLRRGVLFAILTLLLILPLYPCVPGCYGVYRFRCWVADQPGVAPMEAAKIRAFADQDPCDRCDRLRRVPILRLPFEWIYEAFFASQRCANK